jgi:DNA-binding transcriptional LysR family regulator
MILCTPFMLWPASMQVEVSMSVYEHLEFRLLKYIVAVAEAGTFTAAAARIHVAQSAISSQIHALEDSLGIQIFDRERGNALTAEGKVLLRYARQALKTRQHIVDTVQAIQSGRMAPLKLGFTPFVHRTLLHFVSTLYKELIPDGEVLPESVEPDEIDARMRDGDFDAVLLTLPVTSVALRVSVMNSERLLVCMRSDDPLAELEAIPPHALDEKISIFTYQRHHPVAYERMVQMFKQVGITPRPSKPTMNIEHIQWMVKEGICYSLMRAGRPLMNGLVTRPIAGVDWTVDTALASKAEKIKPALALLIEELGMDSRLSTESREMKPVRSVRNSHAPKVAMKTSDRSQLDLFAS